MPRLLLTSPCFQNFRKVPTRSYSPALVEMTWYLRWVLLTSFCPLSLFWRRREMRWSWMTRAQSGVIRFLFREHNSSLPGSEEVTPGAWWANNIAATFRQWAFLFAQTAQIADKPPRMFTALAICGATFWVWCLAQFASRAFVTAVVPARK